MSNEKRIKEYLESNGIFCISKVYYDKENKTCEIDFIDDESISFSILQKLSDIFKTKNINISSFGYDYDPDCTPISNSRITIRFTEITPFNHL